MKLAINQALLLSVSIFTCICYGAAGPDLIITDLWLVGDTVHYQIQNVGTLNCGYPHTTKLKVNGADYDGDVIGQTLLPGQRLNRSFSKTVPCNGFSQTIEVIADANLQIGELKESNNTLTENRLCDQDPPVITDGPQVSVISPGNYRVTWKTDEDADSTVLYAAATGAFTTVSDATQEKDHTIYLNNLRAAVTYRYKVRSADLSGNSVESGLRYFTTAAADDTKAPQASAPRMMKTDQPLFPLRFDMEADDDTGLDRAEFSYDGIHFMTDYDPPFSCYVLPEDTGITYARYFGLNHVVLAEVYDYSENMTAVTTAWTEAMRCPEMELEIELGTSTRIYTPDAVIYDYIDDFEITARKNAGVTIELGTGPFPDVTGTNWDAVDDVRVYFDDVYWGHITPDPEETNLTFPFAIYSLTAPSEHEIKVEIQSGACIMIRRATMQVIRQVTDVRVERSVTRSGTGFEVELTFFNDGTTPAYLDWLSEEAEGFQITCPTSSLYDAIITYDPASRRSHIEYEFNCTVSGGGSRTFHYTVIPILSESASDYRLCENNALRYHDAFDRDYAAPTFPTVSRVGGEFIEDAVDAACDESDYLIITDPALLFGIYDPEAVNQLLAKTAELADVRDGVLGYYEGTGSTYTTYRSTDRFACGNIFGDWRDEMILTDESEDLIRIYSPDRQRTIDDVLPIPHPGLHANDVLLVGNFFDETDPANPEDEFAIVDGHSSGSALGDVVLYDFLPDNDEFDQYTNSTTYNPSEGDQIIAGNMMYHPTVPNRDEIILFKGSTGKVQAYYPTYPVQRQWDSVYQPGDLVTAGDLITSIDGDEIVIGDVSAQHIYIYSGEGDVLHNYALSFGSNDRLQVSPEGLALADSSADKVVIRGVDGMSIWYLGEFDVNVHPNDTFICAHVIEHSSPQYLFARSHREDHFSEGEIEIFPYSALSSETEPGDRSHLDALLNPGGAWANKMGSNFTSSGYLLIVGETEIIPAFSCSYYLTWNGRQYIEFTDNYYGNTADEMKKPEIAVGRIIGNTIAHMMVPIQTSLDIAYGDAELNLAEAYCFSGGPEEMFETARSDVVDALEDKGWHVARNDEPSEDTIYSHTTNIDALYMAAHGNWEHSWNVNSSNVEDRFDPGLTGPIVYACSCRTGRYPESRDTLGEHFLEYGASAYIGATENSFYPWNRYLSEGFFGRLNFDSPIGAALRGSKCDRMGDGSYGKYESAIYHFYGDPKLEASSAAAMLAGKTEMITEELQQADNIQGPVSTVQVSIPAFEVQSTGDGDIASIPGGTFMAEPGNPEVPAWPVQIDFPAGYQVQAVQLTSTEYQSGTGLSLVEVQPAIAGVIYPGPDLPDPDAWPDREYDWTVDGNPDGSTTLTVWIYPLRTWPASTNYTYFNTCSLHIDYVASDAVINRLWTSGPTCAIGDPVTIEMFFYNTSQNPADLIAEAELIQTGAEDNTIGLPIKLLRQVQGLGSCSWTWDTSAAQADTYQIAARLKSTSGYVLAEETTLLQVGTTDGTLSPVVTNPACFGVGEDIKIDTDFTNTGQAPLNPHIIVEVQTLDGEVLERFEDSTTNLTAGSAFPAHWEWDPTVARGQCRFKAYALYDGKSTPVMLYPQISIVADGDFNEDGRVNLPDFATLAQAWLSNTSLCDIAPDGGDCIVDLLDLNIIAEGWLSE